MFGGDKDEDEDIWGSVFGSRKESSSGALFGGKKEGSGLSGLMKGKENSTLDAVKAVVPGFQEEPACAKLCPNLSFKHRMIGFVSCAAFGYMLSLIGTLMLIGPMSPEKIRTFAVLYVFGNVIALCATGFLLGPKSQCTKMWAETRRYSTAFYLAMLIIVFAVALAKQHVALILFLLFVEILAGAWYAASYIPFGRKMILACLKRTICKPCCDAYEASKGGGEK